MDWNSIDFILGIIHKLIAITSTLSGVIFLLHLKYKEKRKDVKND